MGMECVSISHIKKRKSVVCLTCGVSHGACHCEGKGRIFAVALGTVCISSVFRVQFKILFSLTPKHGVVFKNPRLHHICAAHKQGICH